MALAVFALFFTVYGSKETGLAQFSILGMR